MDDVLREAARILRTDRALLTSWLNDTLGLKEFFCYRRNPSSDSGNDAFYKFAMSRVEVYEFLETIEPRTDRNGKVCKWHIEEFDIDFDTRHAEGSWSYERR